MWAYEIVIGGRNFAYILFSCFFLRNKEIIWAWCDKVLHKYLLALPWLTLSCYIKVVLLSPSADFAELRPCCPALLIIQEEKCDCGDQGMAAVNVILPGGKEVRL